MMRVARALTAIALASTFATAVGARAAPPLGANVLDPTSGTASTVFTLAPPFGASCTGGASGTPSYRWQTYLVERSVDASTVTFTSGPVAIPGKFVSPLFDSGDTPIRNRNPSASPLGLISSIPSMSFNALAGTVPVGQYKIGFACTQAGAIENGKYWETPITITNATTTAWVSGWAPDPPPPPPPPPPPSFVPLVPARLLESRVGERSTVDGVLWQIGQRAGGSTTELTVAGRGGVPGDASAVVLNVTVTGPVLPGFVTVFPCGSAPPNASNLNFGVGQTVPNAVIAKVGSGGKVCVFTSTSMDLIVDVNGYFPAA